MADKNQSHAFVGNGKVYLTPVTGGVEGGAFWVGVAIAATIDQSVEDKKTMKEMHTGRVGDWDSIDGGTKTTMKITLNERREKAVKAALQATETVVPTGTVVAELHSVASADDMFFLKHKNASAVVITDSTPTTPQPLVAGVDYKVDEKYGTVEMINLGSLIQPLKVSYSYGETTEIKPMTDNVDYYKIRVNGLNRAGQKGKQVIEAFQGKLDPVSTLELISDDFTTMELEADLLIDENEDAPYKITNL